MIRKEVGRKRQVIAYDTSAPTFCQEYKDTT